MRKVGPKTRDCWWDPRSETRDPSDRWDPGRETRTLKVGPETRDKTHRWDPGTEIRDPKGGTRDPRPGTLKVVFQNIFSVFLEAWNLWMSSCGLCVYVYFVCFSLPYHKVYTLLIFYHLNELFFPSFCKNFHHAAVMKSLGFWKRQW